MRNDVERRIEDVVEDAVKDGSVVIHDKKFSSDGYESRTVILADRYGVVNLIEGNKTPSTAKCMKIILSLDELESIVKKARELQGR